MTTLTEALKNHSRQTHDSVDALVMSMKPFESHDNYRKFLQSQHEFHKAVQPIYSNATIAKQFQGLAELSRYERVKQDMADLGVDALPNPPVAPNYTDAESLGWLYCVEGSNIGAAILYKEAGKIDLDEQKGASHLAAHPDGRKQHWLDVKAKIDQLELDENTRAAALKGADDAFAYFKQIIRQAYS